MAGEAALLSMEGALLVGREGGRVLAGDTPLEGPAGLSREGALLRSGLHTCTPSCVSACVLHCRHDTGCHFSCLQKLGQEYSCTKVSASQL